MGSTNVQFAALIGKESTRGTGVTCDKDIGILIEDISTPNTRELVEAEDIGTIEAVGNYSGMQEGGVTISGSLVHGRMFEFIVGEASHVTTSSDTVHTFHPFDTLPKTFTIQTGSNLSGGDVGLQHVLNTIESAEISTAINELVKLTVSSKAKAPTVITTVPAHVTSSLAAFPHALVAISLNGTEATEVQDFKISFTKATVSVDGIGSNDHIDIIPTSVKVKFSGTLAFTADTFHDHFVNNDVTAVVFNADNAVSLGSGKRAIDIALNDIEMVKFDVTSKIGSLVLVAIEGAAKLNTFTTTDNIGSASWF